MVIREAIRTSYNGRRIQKRLFDCVVEDDHVMLEIKQGNAIITVAWQDVITQVEAILNGDF